MTCEVWQVVVVPFPFTDRAAQKKRPAVVVSQKTFNRHGHSVMAMVTSASNSWPSDCAIRNLSAAGLPHPCVIRLKLFTIDNRFILRRLGTLAAGDREDMIAQMRSIFAL